MADTRFLKNSEWHMEGELTTELACDLDILDVNHVSNYSWLVNPATHLELYGEDEDHELGTQCRDYKVNGDQCHVGDEEFKINRGGHRRDDNEPIAESYWDKPDPDDETLDTETEEDDE